VSHPTTKTPNPTTITAEPGLPFIDIVREFDAPVDAVFRAHTDPTLFAQWMGPRDSPIEIDEYDATAGGRWQWTIRPQNYPEFNFRGVFHTVEPSVLLIQTFEFSLAPGHVGIDATTFEAVDGRTRLTLHEVYPSVEVRDAALASGMEGGVIEGYERLDELLAR
jgi:uncharacterized protein YndB with AHSA1/START domain